jgi:hypothetical protein
MRIRIISNTIAMLANRFNSHGCHTYWQSIFGCSLLALWYEPKMQEREINVYIQSTKQDSKHWIFWMFLYYHAHMKGSYFVILICCRETRKLFSSNFKRLLSEGITTMELSLHLTPLVAKLVPLRTNLVSDNILILGNF